MLEQVLELDLDNDYQRFNRETSNILDALTYACKDYGFAEIQPYIYEIENNLDSYHQEYKNHIEDVLEARYRENKNYYKQVEERKV